MKRSDFPKPTVKAGGLRRQLGSTSGTSLPVYHQLHLVLGQRIREGVYPAGSQLPPEAHLVDTYGVSRVTVRRALAKLEQDGLIVRRQGAGTFVTEHEKQKKILISGEVDNLITIGMETETVLLESGLVENAPPHVLQALNADANTDIVMLLRLRHYRGDPFSLTSVYLRLADALKIKIDDLDTRPVITALEDAGIIAGTAEQSIGAILADDKSAEYLGIPIGSALIRVRRSVRDQAGQALLYQRSLYRPDLYEYHMLLTREHSIGRPRWRPIG